MILMAPKERPISAQLRCDKPLLVFAYYSDYYPQGWPLNYTAWLWNNGYQDYFVATNITNPVDRTLNYTVTVNYNIVNWNNVTSSYTDHSTGIIEPKQTMRVVISLTDANEFCIWEESEAPSNITVSALGYS
jgi:hypothetical protein